MITSIKCPQCGDIFDIATSSSKPFCSERCKLIDLGAWADGSYNIPTEDSPMSERADHLEPGELDN